LQAPARTPRNTASYGGVCPDTTPGVGLRAAEVVPFPICPDALSPQQYVVSLFTLMPHENAAVSDTLSSENVSDPPPSTGVDATSGGSAAPSCPDRFAPQQYAWFVVVSAQA
jgi:hypothetical protein